MNKIIVRELSDFTQSDWDELAVKMAKKVIEEAYTRRCSTNQYDDWERRALHDIGTTDEQVQYIINLHKCGFIVKGAGDWYHHHGILEHTIFYKKRK